MNIASFTKENEQKTGTWADVFESIAKQKDRLLNYEVMINGKKVKREIEEMIFFMGDMRAILTKKGFRFEVPDKKTNISST
jgi:hypothetical protein